MRRGVGWGRKERNFEIYDDQSQMRIHLETQAKLHIQDTIRDGEIELVTSYVLDFENSNKRKRCISCGMCY